MIVVSENPEVERIRIHMDAVTNNLFTAWTHFEVLKQFDRASQAGLLPKPVSLYFSIMHGLRDAALLAICRATDDGKHDGSLYRFIDDAEAHPECFMANLGPLKKKISEDRDQLETDQLLRKIRLRRMKVIGHTDLRVIFDHTPLDLDGAGAAEIETLLQKMLDILNTYIELFAGVKVNFSEYLAEIDKQSRDMLQKIST